MTENFNPTAETVRPRETTILGAVMSKRGTHIKIGGPQTTEYSLSDVMASQRGDKDQPSTACVKGSRDYTPVGVPISTGISRGYSGHTTG